LNTALRWRREHFQLCRRGEDPGDQRLKPFV
jgi:hypothetical protein